MFRHFSSIRRDFRGQSRLIACLFGCLYGSIGVGSPMFYHSVLRLYFDN